MVSLSRCASRSDDLPALLPLLPSLVFLPSLLLARALSPRLLLPAVLIGTLSALLLIGTLTALLLTALLLTALLLSALLLSALLIAILLHREISFEVLIAAARRGGKGCATDR
jgi:hypothetical protein